MMGSYIGMKCWAKEDRHKRLYRVWFHTYIGYKGYSSLENPICGIKVRVMVTLGETGSAWKGAGRGLWDASQFLFPVGMLLVCVCSYHTSGRKIHQAYDMCVFLWYTVLELKGVYNMVYVSTTWEGAFSCQKPTMTPKTWRIFLNESNVSLWQ